MNTRKRFAAVIALVLTLSVLPASQRSYAATPDAQTPQEMRGEWQGFFAEVNNPSSRVQVRLSIATQLVRRFEGELEVPGAIIPCIRVQGTVAASDNVSILNQPDEAYAAVSKSQLHDYGGGAAILNGRLTLRFTDGSRREGTLLLLRNFIEPPDAVVPSLSGDWQGSYTSEVTGVTGAMSARFARSHRDPAVNSFIAEVTIIPCIFPEALATVSSDGRVIVIAQGEGEHVILNGQLEGGGEGGLDPCMRGTYQMEHDDGSQDFGTFDVDRIVM
jgi:hypothetical protein